jgi:hypothetical protein
MATYTVKAKVKGKRRNGKTPVVTLSYDVEYSDWEDGRYQGRTYNANRHDEAVAHAQKLLLDDVEYAVQRRR